MRGALSGASVSQPSPRALIHARGHSMSSRASCSYEIKKLFPALSYLVSASLRAAPPSARGPAYWPGLPQSAANAGPLYYRNQFRPAFPPSLSAAREPDNAPRTRARAHLIYLCAARFLRITYFASTASFVYRGETR